MTALDPNPQTVSELTALAKAAADHDGDPPFSDQTLVQLRTAAHTTTVVGALLEDSQRMVGAAVVVHSDQPDTAAVLEAVVDPAHRGSGTGAAMVTAALDGGVGDHAAMDAWAHGDHAAARALATTLGFTPVRELHRLLRPMTGVTDELALRLPPGLALRAFEVGVDEEAWLAVNAAAFADHPEQGRMTMSDLREREAEDWFDPQGFLIAHPVGDPREIAGFHWTKVHPATHREPARGEVHVVGIAPDQQGRGLGKALTVAGLHHLAQRGLQEVLLYVDAQNTAAFNLYRALGFEPWHVDVMFSRR
ncbi:mycothiol synthase [Kocuria sp.]|uniref:mycothiol synthase n=1 Tax=Kocuria sp. TaxID=1871328 RepID=UPI003F8D19D8